MAFYLSSRIHWSILTFVLLLGLVVSYAKMQLSTPWKWLLTSTALVKTGHSTTTTTATALNITYYQKGASLAPDPLPKSHAASDGAKIVELFANLDRTTTWTLVNKIPFEGDIWEPEGILRLGPDRYIVSAGEYTEPTVRYNSTTTVNGTDRTPGAGFAHLIVFDSHGTRLADATLTPRNALEYHNGGLDFDGTAIWATIAQYRPNSTATIVRVDPFTLHPTNVTHVADHLGAIVHDTHADELVALNWGARYASTFSHFDNSPPPPSSSSSPSASYISTTRNPTSFIDYQDCKFLVPHPTPLMLCSGLASYSTTSPSASSSNFSLGGLAIVDLTTMVPVMEVPITLVSERGTLMTQNPVDVEVVVSSDDGERLRVYWLPDQREGTLYVYEAG